MINANSETLKFGPFNQLLSLSEAAEIWGIDESTIRKAIAAGRIKTGWDCRKFGKQWVVTAEAMRKTFNPYGRTWPDFLADLREKETGQMNLRKARTMKQTKVQEKAQG